MSCEAERERERKQKVTYYGIYLVHKKFERTEKEEKRRERKKERREVAICPSGRGRTGR